MGRNLALNLADHGRRMALFDPWPEARQALAGMTSCDDVQAFVGALARPRRIILLVKAGDPVDRQIDALEPLLDRGDLIVDAGNSHFRDSIRRGGALAAKGLHFLGMGLSGGEAGARHGACLMAGGSEDAYRLIEADLRRVAAHVGGEACCAHLGGDGAGHFVKMIHNGIEYGVMQVIAEAYLLMRDLLGLTAAEIAEVFERWNRGPLGAYLIEITVDILRTADPSGGGPLIDMIQDTAGQKGTGGWAATEALDLGVPAPSLLEAVSARSLSALRDERVAARKVLAGPPRPVSVPERDRFVESLEQALLASAICVHAQGFAVMAAAARQNDWDLDLARTASIWRGGSILRARLLDEIAAACGGERALVNLLMAPALGETLARCQESWREVAASAIAAGLPAPVLCSALAYYDAYRNDRLWANLVQAQRDYFGAHGLERRDGPGTFHGGWLCRGDGETP